MIRLFTNRFRSFVERRVSVLLACSACDPGEGVLASACKARLPLHVFAAVVPGWPSMCSLVEGQSVSPETWGSPVVVFCVVT